MKNKKMKCLLYEHRAYSFDTGMIYLKTKFRNYKNCPIKHKDIEKSWDKTESISSKVLDMLFSKNEDIYTLGKELLIGNSNIWDHCNSYSYYYLTLENLFIEWKQ